MPNDRQAQMEELKTLLRAERAAETQPLETDEGDESEDEGLLADDANPDDPELEGDLDDAEEEAGESEAAAAEGEIKSIADFARAAGWEPEDLYALPMRLANGEEIPLGQIKDKLQEYSRSQAELNQAREQIAAEREQMRQHVDQFMRQVASVPAEITQAEARLESIKARYAQIDWAALKERDPGAYAAMRQDIAQEYAQAENDRDQKARAFHETRQQYLQAAAAQADQQFLARVPEWRDPEVVRREAPEIDRFLAQDIGFNPQELAGIFDPRARIVARMAWQWHQHQKSVKQAKEKVGNAPKAVLRPGRGTQPSKIQEKRAQSLISKAQSTGRQSDKLAAARAVVFGR